jgi:hypothetical protein
MGQHLLGNTTMHKLYQPPAGRTMPAQHACTAQLPTQPIETLQCSSTSASSTCAASERTLLQTNPELAPPQIIQPAHPSAPTQADCGHTHLHNHVTKLPESLSFDIRSRVLWRMANDGTKVVLRLLRIAISDGVRIYIATRYDLGNPRQSPRQWHLAQAPATCHPQKTASKTSPAQLEGSRGLSQARTRHFRVCAHPDAGRAVSQVLGE